VQEAAMDERNELNHPNRLVHMIEAIVALYAFCIVVTALASIAN
jgi:hypothetical protein